MLPRSKSILDRPSDTLLLHIPRARNPFNLTLSPAALSKADIKTAAFQVSELVKIRTQEQVHEIVRVYTPLAKNATNMGSLYLALLWLHLNGKVYDGIPLIYQRFLNTNDKSGSILGYNVAAGILTINTDWQTQSYGPFGPLGEGLALAPPPPGGNYSWNARHILAVMSHLTDETFLDKASVQDEEYCRCEPCKNGTSGPFNQCVPASIFQFGQDYAVSLHKRHVCTNCFFVGKYPDTCFSSSWLIFQLVLAVTQSLLMLILLIWDLVRASRPAILESIGLTWRVCTELVWGDVL